MESLVTLKWEILLEKSRRTRISSRLNSQQKLYHGTYLALTIVSRNKVSLTTRDGLSALTFQQRDNYFSTLSHCMMMMLQMFWMMIIMPLCLTVMSLPHPYQYHKYIPRRYQGLTIWFLSKDVRFHPRKHWIWSVKPHSMRFTQCCTGPH